MRPTLAAHHISKSFNGTPALTDVHLNLYAGEIHSLMGENGAGKSTLIKVITGFYQKDVGQIVLSGNEITPESNHEAQKLGISTVFQEVNLVPTLSVAENIYLGREPTQWGRIDWTAVRTGAGKALAKLDVNIDVDASLDEFPIAIQQMIAIARALDMSAQVLILDEATSSLDTHEVAKLFNVLRRLKSEGLAILFVSHFLDQVYEISDRITVLRNGTFVSEDKISEISQKELVSKMMGHDLLELKKIEKSNLSVPAPSKPWLRCLGIGRKGSMDPFDLDIRNGETQGIAGLLGSGRTEIARLLFGLDEATTGEIEIDGQRYHFKSPRQAIQNGFALCPEDRKSQSVFPGLSLRKNIILAKQARIGWFKKLTTKQEMKIVDHFIKALGIRTKNSEQPIETLSGGNQQKSVLARWMALDPRLLILDEPTRGIDVGAKAEIQKYFSQIISDKKSILFISSELEEVVRNSDRVTVLKDRKKIAELSGQNISQGTIIDTIGNG